MFRSLHMKLMLIMTLLIISLMTVVGAFLVNSVSGFYLEQFYSQMQGVFQNDADFFHDLENAAEGEENGAEQIAQMLDPLCSLNAKVPGGTPKPEDTKQLLETGRKTDADDQMHFISGNSQLF